MSGHPRHPLDQPLKSDASVTSTSPADEPSSHACNGLLVLKLLIAEDELLFAEFHQQCWFDAVHILDVSSPNQHKHQ